MLTLKVNEDLKDKPKLSLKSKKNYTKKRNLVKYEISDKDLDRILYRKRLE